MAVNDILVVGSVGPNGDPKTVTPGGAAGQAATLAGNLAIGGQAAPAWHPSFVVYQQGSAWTGYLPGGGAYQGLNCYLDATSTWRYASNGAASLVAFGSGGWTFYNAPSGTAGAAITFGSFSVASFDGTGKITNHAGFMPDFTLTDNTARTYTANTWYQLPGTVAGATPAPAYICKARLQWDTISYHEISGAFMWSPVLWKAAGTQLSTTFPMEGHALNDVSAQVRGGFNENGARSLNIMFDQSLTVSAGGYLAVYGKLLF